MPGALQRLQEREASQQRRIEELERKLATRIPFVIYTEPGMMVLYRGVTNRKGIGRGCSCERHSRVSVAGASSTRGDTKRLTEQACSAVPCRVGLSCGRWLDTPAQRHHQTASSPHGHSN